MTLIELLLLIVVGAIVGVIAEVIVGHGPGGLFGSVVIGFLGAVLGDWLAIQFGLPVALPVRVGVYTIEVLWAVVGAIILLLTLGWFRRGYQRK